jgi:diguanylate cyclase (GGDEF)-like protein
MLNDIQMGIVAQSRLQPKRPKRAEAVSKRRKMWVLRRQLAENARNSGGAAIGNLINAIIATVLFWDVVPTLAIGVFWSALALTLNWRMATARRLARVGRSLEGLQHHRRGLIGSAVALGALWGSVITGMFIWGSSEQTVFAGILGAGMISAGAISYRTVRAAASGYVFAAIPGSLVGLIHADTVATYSAAGLLICFVGVLIINIRHTAGRFEQGCLRELELHRSRDTIRLLLHDHIEQGSDWIVSVDNYGRIVEATHRFAAAAQRPQESLEQLRFVDLLDDDGATADLRKLVKHGHAIRNHIVSLTVGGEKRWWSISGRTVREGDVSYRGVITDITAQRRAEEKVSYMAHYDGLTDLPNRFLFNEQLYHALRRDGRAALLFLDLDHFKAVNDTLGHVFGDKLLQVAARRIEATIGKDALLARLGGDEFAILLTGRRIDSAETVAASVISAMEQRVSLEDHDVVVGVTIGIAMAPTDGTDAETLMRNADLALYAAKGLGRNRFARFEPGMDEAAKERRLLEMDLRGALGKQEMRLHYQPIINTVSGEISGYEALVRWKHPQRGIVMPSNFIPIAEDTGLIVQLGEWVIRQALKDLSDWPDHLSVSINLSPVQMRSAGLITTLVNAIAATRVDPGRICVEITETVLMQDSEANIETLHKLREIGVHIALDDFGTGYSSLNYLRSFPFSKIKIDRCFVNEIDSREDCRAIVRSVVSLANSLGMSTTAEGVERREQVEQLRLEGCGEVQGFLYSKAVPAEELTDLRAQRHAAPPPIPFADRANAPGSQAAVGESVNSASIPRRQIG